MNVRIDNNGDYVVIWAGTDDEVLGVAAVFLQKNGSVPAGEKLPAELVGLIQTVYDQAKGAKETAVTSEAERAKASELFREAMTVAKAKLEVAFLRLKGNHATHLAELEDWGLSTKVAKDGRSAVKKPANERDWIAFLYTYTAKEQSLAAAQQISDPSLAEMVALADKIRTNDAARQTNQSKRESGTQARSETVAQLHMLLQTAALYLVAVRWNGRVGQELQQWGFNVVARQPIAAPVPEPENS